MRDLRVIEVAGGVAGAYCARLFAVMGADVVLVEPPSGGPLRAGGPHFTATDGTTRSAPHEHLDAGKRSVTIDLDGPDGDAALAWADVVVATFDGQPEAAFALRERLRLLDPRTSLVAISGFGLTGPFAGWRTSDLVDWASGGYLFLNGEPGRPPLQGGGPWASIVVGTTAAVGGAVAVLDATLTGEGQLVDVGGMEATAAGHQWALTQYTHTGVLKRRVGLGFEHFHPLGPHRCLDGWIVIAAPSAEQWNQTLITCEAWELMLDETLIAPAARADRAAEIDAALDPWLSTHTCAEAIAALQANRVPAGKLNDLHEVLASEHLAVRHAWTERPDLGPAAKAASVPVALQPGPPTVTATEPAHALGADTAAFVAALRTDEPRRPFPPVDLRDLRVAEFSIAWAGPLTGRFLADLGAEVIKVEHPGSRGVGHEGRTRLIGGPPGWRFGEPVDPQIRAEVFPGADPGERFWNRSGVWNVMNRGKRSLAMEAKTPAGRAILEQVLAGADIVLHNFSPRGASSLGIDAPAVAKLNPDAITIAMTGYGETGPMALFFSFGPLLEAYCGLNSMTGYLGEEPLRLGKAFPDVVGGLHGTFTTLCAVWERAATDAAVHADVSQLEALASVVGDALLWTSVTGELPARRGNRSLDHAPQGVYRCAGDDAWLAVTVTGDAGWRSLAELVGADDADLSLAERFARHDDLDVAIERWTAGRDALDAAAQLQALGIPACPAFSNGDLVDSEQLAARGFMVTWDQPDVGPQRFPGFPIHFEGRRYVPVAAPALGADNAAILQRLGYADSQIAALADDGVIADRPPW